MMEVPFNNLDEHIARFTASKKTLNATSSTGGGKQFTFKKSLSLNRNNNKLNRTLCSIENWSSLSIQEDSNQFSAPETLNLDLNEKNQSLTSNVKNPVPNVKNTARKKQETLFVKNQSLDVKSTLPNEKIPTLPKKQETISSFFLKSSVKKSEFQNNLQKTFKDTTLEDDPFADDLDDFDLTCSKIELDNVKDLSEDILHKELVSEALLLDQDLPKPNSPESTPNQTEFISTSNTNASTYSGNQCNDLLSEATSNDYEINEIKNSPLLKENHYQEMSLDKIKSIMSSLDEMNYSVMSKVCSAIENDQVLRRNPNLSPLIDIRNKILQRSSAAEKVIITKTNSKPTSSFYSKLCSSEEPSVIPLTPKVQRLKTTPLFGSSNIFHDSKLPNSNTQIENIHDFNLSNSIIQNDDNPVKKPVKTDFHTFKQQPNGCIDIEAVETQLLDLDLEVFEVSDNELESEILNENDHDQSQQEMSNCQAKNVIKGKFYGDQRDDGASADFKGHNFPHSDRLMEIFLNVFGLQKFRHNQLEAINAALLNEDCFILMPTGGGKSLCYQLPAMVTNGVTIVISPLRSLIMDQVQKLWSLDIPASSLSGDVDASSANSVYRQLASKEIDIKLLYVTPEKISASNKLNTCIENLYARKMIQRFIIDEAHCVSQWGHDFRPDYKKLKVLREKFPGVPMVALTATATQRVRFDILNQLGMKSPKWFLQSFNRPNLKYEVRPKKSKSVVQDIISLIKSKFKNMCGIVYCLSRNDCDSMAQELSENGIQAVSYHAGLNNRNEVQELWMDDKFKVVCATIAFGMGIDKPDVRFVIHHSIPKSIEGYYQESGRAGRDGEVSWCVVFYNYQDMQRIKRMIQKDEANKFSWKTHMDNLFRLVQYCENKADCRRVQMLEYFGEIFDKKLCANNRKTACDNCFSKEEFELCDMSENAKMIVQCVAKLVDKQKHRNYTLTYFVDLFKGAKTQKIISAGHDKLPLHGRGHNFHRADAERFLRKLVLDGYLREDLIINKMDLPISYTYLGQRSSELMTGKCKVLFSVGKNSKTNTVAANTNIDKEDEEMLQLTERCYTELIEVSKTIAAERKMHYTNVINVKALRQMAREVPMTEADMLTIPHVTRAVYDKYGAKFLAVTEKYGVEKCVIESERVDKQMLLAFNDDNIDNWSNSEAEAEVSVNNSNMKGKKRKRFTKKGASGFQKRFKFNNFKRKQPKDKAKVTKGKGAKSSPYATNKSFPFNKATTSNVSKAPGFLPAPKLQTKPPSRSFLQPSFSTF